MRQKFPEKLVNKSEIVMVDWKNMTSWKMDDTSICFCFVFFQAVSCQNQVNTEALLFSKQNLKEAFATEV